MAVRRVLIVWDIENVQPPDRWDGRVHCAYHIGRLLVQQGAGAAGALLDTPPAERCVLDQVLVAAEWAKRFKENWNGDSCDEKWRQRFADWHNALSHTHNLLLLDCPGKRSKIEAEDKLGEAITCFARSCHLAANPGIVLLLSTDKDLKSYVEEAQTHGLSVVVVHNEKVNPYFKAAATHSIEWEPFLASFVPFFKTTGRSTAPGSCTQTPSAAPVPIPTECNLPAHMAEVPPRSQVAESEEISLRPMSLRPGGEGKNPFAAFGKRTVVADEVKHQTQRQSPQRGEAGAAAAPQQAAAQQPRAQQQQSQQQQQQQQQQQPAQVVNPTQRQIKGILNKLTPNNFECLLEQLLSVVTSAELLKSTITLVFENAVAQPTLCSMYAHLCLRLSSKLPSFPPPPGEAKELSFKRVLLNTWQDEFVGTMQARADMDDMPPGEERDVAEKKVRMRMLGTVRLIAELHRQEVVKETIITVVIQELLRGNCKGPKADVPPEDNIESACQVITICGKKLSESSEKGTRDKLEAYMHRLAALTEEKNLSSRIRFITRDVIDMRKNKWVPRRETFTAKKLDEVHAQAEAKLGMVSSKLATDLALPALPTRSRLAPEDFTLLPPLRGMEAGWEVVGKKGTATKRDAGYSARTGE